MSMFVNETEYMYSIVFTDSSSRSGIFNRAIPGVIGFLDDVIGSEMVYSVVTNTAERAF